MTYNYSGFGFQPIYFSGAVICISGLTTIGDIGFGGAIHYESEGRRIPELVSFRQTPDPVMEMEQFKSDLDVMLKAERLLKEVLGEGRYKEFLQAHQLTIPSKLYKDRYYIVREWGRIEVIQSGRILEELCIVPTTQIATQDVLALRKLMLEQNEKEFLKISNHFPRTPPDEEPSRARAWLFGRRGR